MNFESESKHLCAPETNCHTIDIQKEIETTGTPVPARRDERPGFAGPAAARGPISPDHFRQARIVDVAQPSRQVPGQGLEPDRRQRADQLGVAQLVRLPERRGAPFGPHPILPDGQAAPWRLS